MGWSCKDNLPTRYFGCALFPQEYMRSNKKHTFISVSELYSLLDPFHECWNKMLKWKGQGPSWLQVRNSASVCVTLNAINEW